MIYLIISVLMFRLTSRELSVYVCLISLNCLVSSHDLCLGNDVYRILELSKVLHCKNWLQMKMKLWLYFSIKCGSFICMMISFFQTMLFCHFNYFSCPYTCGAVWLCSCE